MKGTAGRKSHKYKEFQVTPRPQQEVHRTGDLDTLRKDRAPCTPEGVELCKLVSVPMFPAGVAVPCMPDVYVPAGSYSV